MPCLSSINPANNVNSIWFHASILQLFRPFAQHTVEPIIQNDFAVAAFTASLNQLKHLAVLFRYKFACAPYAAFWHTALLHVANAVMQDTEDPQWRSYFVLCLDSYAELYSSFRIAGGIVKSLLSIALRLKAITVSEAHALLAQVSEKGLHHTDIDDISASFVVDLNLVYVDRVAAQLTSLNKAFDDLALFGEFTEIEPDTSAKGELPLHQAQYCFRRAQHK